MPRACMTGWIQSSCRYGPVVLKVDMVVQLGSFSRGTETASESQTSTIVGANDGGACGCPYLAEGVDSSPRLPSRNTSVETLGPGLPGSDDGGARRRVPYWGHHLEVGPGCRD